MSMRRQVKADADHFAPNDICTLCTPNTTITYNGHRTRAIMRHVRKYHSVEFKNRMTSEVGVTRFVLNVQKVIKTLLYQF